MLNESSSLRIFTISKINPKICFSNFKTRRYENNCVFIWDSFGLGPSESIQKRSCRSSGRFCIFGAVVSVLYFLCDVGLVRNAELAPNYFKLVMLDKSTVIYKIFYFTVPLITRISGNTFIYTIVVKEIIDRGFRNIAVATLGLILLSRKLYFDLESFMEWRYLRILVRIHSYNPEAPY